MRNGLFSTGSSSSLMVSVNCSGREDSLASCLTAEEEKGRCDTNRAAVICQGTMLHKYQVIGVLLYHTLCSSDNIVYRCDIIKSI